MASAARDLATLTAHQLALRSCRRCPGMIGPVVHGPPVLSRIYLLGQAPGPHEGRFGRPFAWTAGKTLFRWFAGLGVDEAAFRARAHMAAVCRCFPGKAPSGGDRVPAPSEIAACSAWMQDEIALLQPDLIIPVGRLAIAQVLGGSPLAEIIGQSFRRPLVGRDRDIIPLPHPSGASTWFKMEPGRTLLGQALARLASHPSWQATFAAAASGPDLAEPPPADAPLASAAPPARRPGRRVPPDGA